MNNKKDLGIIIGRFQPLHTGHVGLIKEALEACEKTLVLIGSQRKLPDYRDPFTYEQRLSVISKVFANEILLGSLEVVGLPDRPTNEEWIQDITGHALARTEDVSPENIRIYTSTKDEEFYSNNFLFDIDSTHHDDIHSTDIRRVLYDYSRPVALPEIESLVPKETMDFLRTEIYSDQFQDLKTEYRYCMSGKAAAELAHKFSNPIEPVCHAVVVQKEKVLLVRRVSKRGNGQWALPGGFMEKHETTREAALRELKEETGVSLEGRNAAQLACTVEENLRDLSVRTLGVNYLFVVHESEKIDVDIDLSESSEYKWCSMADILHEKEMLFYNHNLVVQRLIGTWDMSNQTGEIQ